MQEGISTLKQRLRPLLRREEPPAATTRTAAPSAVSRHCGESRTPAERAGPPAATTHAAASSAVSRCCAGHLLQSLETGAPLVPPRLSKWSFPASLVSRRSFPASLVLPGASRAVGPPPWCLWAVQNGPFTGHTSSLHELAIPMSYTTDPCECWQTLGCGRAATLYRKRQIVLQASRQVPAHRRVPHAAFLSGLWWKLLSFQPEPVLKCLPSLWSECVGGWVSGV